MTVIPRGTDHDTKLVVVCDRCGSALHAKGKRVRDFAAVWTAATYIGWNGNSGPVGPHFCAACGTQMTSVQPHNRPAGAIRVDGTD